MADEAKARGNKAFSAGQYEEAIAHFSEAISLAPENHVLYSNRSASYASLKKWDEALEDAKKTVELKEDWAKGYSRLGAAYSGLELFEDAVSAYEKGLEKDPNNEVLKSSLEETRSKLEKDSFGMGGMAKVFQSPDIFAKLLSNLSTKPFMTQPDFVRKLQDLQKNPDHLSMYLSDQRMTQALMVLLGVGGMGMPTGDSMDVPDFSDREAAFKPAEQSSEPEPVPEPEPEPEPMETEEDEKEKRKAEALREKEAGNAAYKKKEFEKAIEHYTKALELFDEDVSFLTNRAAVHLEMGNYDSCIKDCDDAVEIGRHLHADYKVIAKALTRKGTAYVKMAKTSVDFEPAIAAFNKALTEHRNPDTLKKLNDAERTKKELEQQEYFSPEIGDQEREKGNEFFKKMLYPEAVKHYTEAIKRNPKDVKAYSNRAASYTKLTALPEALKDSEKCIELDPTFVKGYLRKGAVKFFMKEYDKAMEVYKQGLEIDPGNSELQEGVRSCLQQIRKLNSGDVSAEDLKERQAKSMQDPEIQAILTDPIMRQVLTDFQENPKAAMEHQRNPMIMAKINKLVAAGIVQVR